MTDLKVGHCVNFKLPFHVLTSVLSSKCEQSYSHILPNSACSWLHFGIFYWYNSRIPDKYIVLNISHLRCHTRDDHIVIKLTGARLFKLGYWQFAVSVCLLKSNSATHLLPSCIKSKDSFIFSRGMLWVTNSSTFISPRMYSSTSLGTLSTLFQPGTQHTCIIIIRCDCSQFQLEILEGQIWCHLIQCHLKYRCICWMFLRTTTIMRIVWCFLSLCLDGFR